MTFEELYRAWKEGRISQLEAAMFLGVSVRTFRRYIHRYELAGSEGLIDRRVSQGSPRRAPLDEVAEVVNTYNTRHEGWNVKQFFAWYRHTGGQRSYNWVRMQLQDAGAVKKLPRRGWHRKQFELASRTGTRLFQDGRSHEWLRDRRCDLIITLDDATGTHYSALLCEAEGTSSSLAGVRQVIERHGLFCSLHTDRALHYWSATRAAVNRDQTKLTQFGRAMKQLGIKMIPTRSAQVRIRCQRAFCIHMERLPDDLAAAGVTELAEANEYLDTVYRHAYNKEFEQLPREHGSAFEPCPKPDLLDDILCEHHQRTVRNDKCVRFDGHLLRLPADRLPCDYAKTRVTVRRHLNGTLSVSRGLRPLARYDANGSLLDQGLLTPGPVSRP